MTHTAVIPDYLKPAIERLETAREEHLINARHMDETTASSVSMQSMNLMHPCVKAAVPSSEQ